MPFHEGDRVRTRVMNPSGHARMPTYLRGREGRVERLVGEFPFPGERATGNANAAKQRLYTVRFVAPELWGADAAQRTEICADLFESYLETSG